MRGCGGPQTMLRVSLSEPWAAEAEPLTAVRERHAAETER
jgi:hypothetical protein